jgi:hypothetical protein
MKLLWEFKTKSLFFFYILENNYLNYQKNFDIFKIENEIKKI